MTHPNMLILYVTDAQAACRLYGRLLALEPVESSPTFAMFVLSSGIRLRIGCSGSSYTGSGRARWRRR